jgi:DNA-binding XRE family transcriptional regulator
MSDAEATLDGSQPLTARQAALADIAERRRKDPNWNHQTDPTYSGPHPTFVSLMSDAEYDRHMAGIVERRQLGTNPSASRAIEYIEPQLMPRRVARAALPFGQRIRDLRRALGWSQRDVAWQLGVSARTIIRYEQGRSSPLRSAALLALRRLESAHARELDTIMPVSETS